MSASAPHFEFNNGTKIPAIGLGCWMGAVGGGQRVYDMCEKALKAGYRHFDTAAGYGNEKQVGEAIRASGIPREEIYITTKLANSDHHRVREAFESSLKELDCEYIDLYLMHWPQASISEGETGNASFTRVLKSDESPTIIDTYKEMEKLLETGKVKSIGVSNFSIKTLSQLLPHVKVIPVTNQIEMHPCLPNEDLKTFCDEKGILLTAYSPLGRSATFFEHPLVNSIAVKNNTTAAQVLLSWGVQRKTIVVPKSENEDRLKANITPITLSSEDFQAIDDIHKEPGMHKSLLKYHTASKSVFGWTYEELGWNFSVGGVVSSKTTA
ncbi:aldo/keto reductase [Macrolepiota fuliginosa MF-IS2]|uniref:Aldo/keto reductase n=1 Tax=Macrolepiota fuliginosa MF-IS2 TaxID=1400762 RepID=A0A9P5XRG6_9AGAR|nr:aldo/keto reductase [Macrolepiota fuliginosa MF-IS2]